MDLLSLYVGLLLPWLGGATWLIFIESRITPRNVANRFRQVGYGFFLGYVALFIAIMVSNKFTGVVSWPGLMVFLGLFAGSGSLAIWLSKGSITNQDRPVTVPQSKAIKLLTSLLLAWIAVHLLLVAVDIFTQPVYPWDAWLAWVYRAKAWFMAGNITTVVSGGEWITATSPGVYSIEAWMYPLFPSVIPLWAAISLGHWSEILVNVPVLFAAIAMGMALYGQCREYGLTKTISIACCYLLFSIPLVGTHFALAGYADIWMAGFTGLGFIALIRASIMRAEDPGAKFGVQMMLAVVMLALAVLVKNEGTVWFLAALAMLIMVTYRARVPILIAVGLTLVTLLSTALGTTHVNIPLIGTLGFVDGRLIVPYVGNFALELHNIWQVYWVNFITMGSWNLLWVLVMAGIALSIKPTVATTTSHALKVTLVFFGVFLTTQLFIFGFTDQGLWADTFTAINRLPLHFMPALLFSVFVILDSRLGVPVGAHDNSTEGINSAVEDTSSAGRDALSSTTQIRDQRSWSLPQIAQATSLSFILVAAGALLYLSQGLPKETTPYQQPAAGLTFAFGSGHPQQDHMVVDSFDNGYALLTSGLVNVQADTHQVLRYTWIPSGKQGEAAFFWRRKDQTDDVMRSDIIATGTHLIDLSLDPDWKGEIIEIGFLVRGQENETVKVGQVTLSPDDFGMRLQLIWQSWTSFEQRSQQSINFLQGSGNHQTIPLPVLLIAWLLTTILLLRLLPKGPRGKALLMLSAVLLLAAWMLLDIRWTANNFKQAQLSWQSSWHVSEDQRLIDDLDGEIYQYVKRLKSEVLGDAPSRILIIGSNDAIDYFLLRAKYHLLPHSADVIGRIKRGTSPQLFDYVIFFGPPDGISKARGWGRRWSRSLKEVERNDWGAVYRVKH